ncbi:unnamed protein product [Colias eurytheme]|nr:unnamed protein product [Colias eurytheme]
MRCAHDELAAAFDSSNDAASSSIHHLSSENCSAQRSESGTQTLLAVYNAPKSMKSLDHLRYTPMHYVKSTKLNKPVQLSNIPATSAAAHQHFNRVYYQVQTWLGLDLEPRVVVVRDADAGKRACNALKHCGQCNGQACLNALPYQSDISEDGTFDSEIMEELETNVVEYDNEDQFEIYQQPEDDDEEEEDN